MNESMVHVQFQGFHPSSFIKSYFENYFGNMREETPSGSTVRAVVTRRQRLFRATIRINSAAGSFFAIAQDKSLPGLTRNLHTRIRRQLGRWKTKRLRGGGGKGGAHGTDVA